MPYASTHFVRCALGSAIGLTLALSPLAACEADDASSAPGSEFTGGGGNADTSGAPGYYDQGGAAYEPGAPSQGPAPLPPAEPEPTDEPPVEDGNAYEDPGTNPFTMAEHDPWSTFAADVDTASYDQLLQQVGVYGSLPNPASVRVEEYVNAFDYGYDAPEWGAAVPFLIDVEAAQNPYADTTLFRVGIQAPELPEDYDVAKNLVFLVDTSGSMQSDVKLPLVKTLLSEAAQTLDADDTLSIVTYAGNVNVALPATPASDSSTIQAAIDALGAGGSTAGAAGIQLAYEQAEAAFIEGGLNHVLLCTDGDFNVGPYSDDALVDLIEGKRETGITLTVLGFGSGNLNDSMMEKVSNAGNGTYAVIFSLDQAVDYAWNELESAMAFVAQDLKIQVVFNPHSVTAYRLLGYENRAIADEDFTDDTVDAGEVGAGHNVTAVYELVLRDQSVPEVEGAPEVVDGDQWEGDLDLASADMAKVLVRWKDVGASIDDAAYETAKLLPEVAVSGDIFEASDDLQWQAGMIQLAEILKGSPYGFEANLPMVADLLMPQAALASDRAELVELLNDIAGYLAAPLDWPEPGDAPESAAP